MWDSWRISDKFVTSHVIFLQSAAELPGRGWWRCSYQACSRVGARHKKLVSIFITMGNLCIVHYFLFSYMLNIFSCIGVLLVFPILSQRMTPAWRMLNPCIFSPRPHNLSPASDCTHRRSGWAIFVHAISGSESGLPGMWAPWPCTITVIELE